MTPKLKYVFARDTTEYFQYNFRKPRNLNLKKQNSLDKVEGYKKLLRVRDLKVNSIFDDYSDLYVALYDSKSWKDKYKVKRQYMKNLQL